MFEMAWTWSWARERGDRYAGKPPLFLFVKRMGELRHACKWRNKIDCLGARVSALYTCSSTHR